MKDRPHDDVMAEVFRKDSVYAAELLNTMKTEKQRYKYF